MIAEGVRAKADVDALAVRSDREVSVLAWNYHDDDVPGVDARVRIEIAGVPDGRVLLRHYRIDADAQQCVDGVEEDGIATAVRRPSSMRRSKIRDNCRSSIHHDGSR